MESFFISLSVPILSAKIQILLWKMKTKSGWKFRLKITKIVSFLLFASNFCWFWRENSNFYPKLARFLWFSNTRWCCYIFINSPENQLPYIFKELVLNQIQKKQQHKKKFWQQSHNMWASKYSMWNSYGNKLITQQRI